MLILISPAKSLDLEPLSLTQYSQPKFKREALELNGVLKEYTNEDLQSLMHISEKIAHSNVLWNKNFKKSYNLKNAKQAAFMFKGTVYLGLNMETFSEEDIAYAQNHLGILSGLYGLLRPLDLIHPYRLEMGSKLKVNGFNNLYQYWDNKITKAIDHRLKTHKEKIVLNLASNEYFKAVKKTDLKAKIINIVFKENREGQYKIIAFNAKKARGSMANFILKNRIETIEGIKTYFGEGYIFNPDLSDAENLIFTK